MVNASTPILSSLGLALLGSTSERMRKLTDWDAAIRAPITTSRRISFVQVRGGAGASTTASYVAGILAARRRGLVLGVDATGSVSGLASLSGGPARTVPSGRRRRARGTTDAIDGLHRASSGVQLLSVAAAQSGAVPATSAWLADVAPVARFFDAICTDWGERGWRGDLADVAGLSHTVCLVSRADRRFAEEAVALVDAIASSAERPNVVVALVDVGDSAGRAPAVMQRASDAAIVSVPFDGAWASATPGSRTPLSARTRLAYTHLAAEVSAPRERGPR